MVSLYGTIIDSWFPVTRMFQTCSSRSFLHLCYSACRIKCFCISGGQYQTVYILFSNQWLGLLNATEVKKKSIKKFDPEGLLDLCGGQVYYYTGARWFAKAIYFFPSLMTRTSIHSVPSNPKFPKRFASDHCPKYVYICTQVCLFLIMGFGSMGLNNWTGK